MVLTQKERDGREELRAGVVLLFFLCLIKKESDEDELAFVRYKQFVALLDDVREALKCACLP